MFVFEKDSCFEKLEREGMVLYGVGSNEATPSGRTRMRAEVGP